MTGIDLAEEMVAIALDRAAQLDMSESVKFLLGDVLETSFAEPFDIIWSRDAFMHIPDKARLFGRLHQLLAPGGRLVITDYARGKKPGSAEFERYIETTGYHVVEPNEYGRLLRGRWVQGRRRRRRDRAVHRDSPERGGAAGHQPQSSSSHRSRNRT